MNSGNMLIASPLPLYRKELELLGIAQQLPVQQSLLDNGYRLRDVRLALNIGVFIFLADQFEEGQPQYSFFTLYDYNRKHFVNSIRLSLAPQYCLLSMMEWIPPWHESWLTMTEKTSTVVDEMWAKTGCLAVGTSGGLVALMEVRVGPGYIQHVEPLTTKVISVANAQPQSERQVALLPLDGNFFASRYFVFQNERSQRKFEFDKASVHVTCLKYMVASNELVVGYNKGGMQIWQVSELVIKYSQSPDGTHVVRQSSYAEPDDDPRNFLYLWTNRVPRKQENCTICLYQLCYQNRKLHPSTALNTYWDLIRTVLAMVIPLPDSPLDTHFLSSSPLVPRMARPRNTNTSTVCPPAEGGDEKRRYMKHSTCKIKCEACTCHTWLVKNPQSSEAVLKVAIFDFNQWYLAQTPPRVSLNATGECPFYTQYSYPVDVSVWRNGVTSGQMSITVESTSLRPFHCWFRNPVPEPFLTPSALSFGLLASSGSHILHVAIQSQQELLLAQLERSLLTSSEGSSRSTTEVIRQLQPLLRRFEECGLVCPQNIDHLQLTTSSSSNSFTRHTLRWLDHFVLFYATHGHLKRGDECMARVLQLFAQSAASHLNTEVSEMHVDSQLCHLMHGLRSLVDQWNGCFFAAERFGDLNDSQMTTFTSVVMQLHFLHKIFSNTNFLHLIHEQHHVMQVMRLLLDYFYLLEILVQYRLLPTKYNSMHGEPTSEIGNDPVCEMSSSLINLLLQHCTSDEKSRRCLEDLVSQFGRVVSGLSSSSRSDGVQYSQLRDSVQAICQLPLLADLHVQFRQAILLYALADWLLEADTAEADIKSFSAAVEEKLKIHADVSLVVLLMWMVDHEKWYSLHQYLLERLGGRPGRRESTFIIEDELFPGVTESIIRRVMFAASTSESARLVLSHLHRYNHTKELLLCQPYNNANFSANLQLFLRIRFVVREMLDSCIRWMRTWRTAPTGDDTREYVQLWMCFFGLLDEFKQWRELTTWLTEQEENFLATHLRETRVTPFALQLYYLSRNRVGKACPNMSLGSILSTCRAILDTQSSSSEVRGGLDNVHVDLDAMTITGPGTERYIYRLIFNKGNSRGFGLGRLQTVQPPDSVVSRSEEATFIRPMSRKRARPVSPRGMPSECASLLRTPPLKYSRLSSDATITSARGGNVAFGSPSTSSPLMRTFSPMDLSRLPVVSILKTSTSASSNTKNSNVQHPLAVNSVTMQDFTSKPSGVRFSSQRTADRCVSFQDDVVKNTTLNMSEAATLAEESLTTMNESVEKGEESHQMSMEEAENESDELVTNNSAEDDRLDVLREDIDNMDEPRVPFSFSVPASEISVNVAVEEGEMEEESLQRENAKVEDDSHPVEEESRQSSEVGGGDEDVGPVASPTHTPLSEMSTSVHVDEEDKEEESPQEENGTVEDAHPTEEESRQSPEVGGGDEDVGPVTNPTHTPLFEKPTSVHWDEEDREEESPQEENGTVEDAHPTEEESRQSPEVGGGDEDVGQVTNPTHTPLFEKPTSVHWDEEDREEESPQEENGTVEDAHPMEEESRKSPEVGGGDEDVGPVASPTHTPLSEMSISVHMEEEDNEEKESPQEENGKVEVAHPMEEESCQSSEVGGGDEDVGQVTNPTHTPLFEKPTSVHSDEEDREEESPQEENGKVKHVHRMEEESRQSPEVDTDDEDVGPVASPTYTPPSEMPTSVNVEEEECEESLQHVALVREELIDEESADSNAMHLAEEDSGKWQTHVPHVVLEEEDEEVPNDDVRETSLPRNEPVSESLTPVIEEKEEEGGRSDYQVALVQDELVHLDVGEEESGQFPEGGTADVDTASLPKHVIVYEVSMPVIEEKEDEGGRNQEIMVHVKVSMEESGQIPEMDTTDVNADSLPTHAVVHELLVAPGMPVIVEEEEEEEYTIKGNLEQQSHPEENVVPVSSEVPLESIAEENVPQRASSSVFGSPQIQRHRPRRSRYQQPTIPGGQHSPAKSIVSEPYAAATTSTNRGYFLRSSNRGSMISGTASEMLEATVTRQNAGSDSVGTRDSDLEDMESDLVSPSRRSSVGEEDNASVMSSQWGTLSQISRVSAPVLDTGRGRRGTRSILSQPPVSPVKLRRSRRHVEVEASTTESTSQVEMQPPRKRLTRSKQREEVTKEEPRVTRSRHHSGAESVPEVTSSASISRRGRKSRETQSVIAELPASSAKATRLRRQTSLLVAPLSHTSTSSETPSQDPEIAATSKETTNLRKRYSLRQNKEAKF